MVPVFEHKLIIDAANNSRIKNCLFIFVPFTQFAHKSEGGHALEGVFVSGKQGRLENFPPRRDRLRKFGTQSFLITEHVGLTCVEQVNHNPDPASWGMSAVRDLEIQSDRSPVEAGHSWEPWRRRQVKRTGNNWQSNEGDPRAALKLHFSKLPLGDVCLGAHDFGLPDIDINLRRTDYHTDYDEAAAKTISVQCGVTLACQWRIFAI